MEHRPIEWYDQFEDSRERKIWTEQEHTIPALRMIGYHNASHAQAPLEAHFHPGCFEFTYILQGNLHFFADDRDYILSGGDFFFTRPNEIHSTGQLPMSLHRICWFQLDVQDPEHFLFLDPRTARQVIDQLCQLDQRVTRASQISQELLRLILSNITDGSEIGRLQAGVLLGGLLCQLLKDSGKKRVRTTADISRATAYIEEHICEQITLEELAQVSILSVSQFKKKFKDQLGTSPRSYINFQKIELAKKALEAGNSVTDTAMALNFSSSDYFSVVFRRYTALSPTEYIRRSKNDFHSSGA